MRDDAGRLQDILEAIQKIQKYADRGRNAFESEELIQTWIVHNIQIIGEAACRLSPEFIRRYPFIPWKDIIGMRNIIVHDYFGVDCDAVWQVVEKDISGLKCRIEQIIATDNTSPFPQTRRRRSSKTAPGLIMFSLFFLLPCFCNPAPAGITLARPKAGLISLTFNQPTVTHALFPARDETCGHIFSVGKHTPQRLPCPPASASSP